VDRSTSFDPQEVASAAAHVVLTIAVIAETADRVEHPNPAVPRDDIETWAMVLAITTALRAMIEFLVGRWNPQQKSSTWDARDITPSMFCDWTTPATPEVESLRAALDDLDSDVAHLSRRRLRTDTWNFHPVIRDLVVVLRDFTESIERDGMLLAPVFRAALDHIAKVAATLPGERH
jgi:hypothetical protein